MLLTYKKICDKKIIVNKKIFSPSEGVKVEVVKWYLQLFFKTTHAGRLLIFFY